MPRCNCGSSEPGDALKGHRVASVVLLQRGWWVWTKNNRGATNAVVWERKARYIFDELKVSKTKNRRLTGSRAGSRAELL